jgi:hypothetical protein
MSRLTRSSTGIVGLIATGAVVAVCAATVGAKPASKGRADSGVVYFAVTRAANGKQYAAGNSTDKLFGSGAVTYVIKAAATPKGAVKITAKPVKLYFANGTLTGTASATLTPGPGGTATITGGKLNAAHGTSGQAGHSETATFHGTGSTTTASYRITYTGIYK